MPAKPYNIPNIFPANTVMNATTNSKAIQLFDVYNFAVQVVFTGTPTGNFKLQSSCDSAINAVSSGNYAGTNLPTNWTDIANSTFNIAAAGNVEWNFAYPGYTWVRVVYTDTSSGSSTAIITSSTFNGKGA